MYKLYSFVLILLLSGSMMLPDLEAQRRPSWVKQRPSDPAYYIGVAMTAKDRSDAEMQYARDARRRALEEMSSEISVTVSSNSLLHQFEDDYRFREQFESKIHTAVEQTLEGYEVHTWENRREYWVMVRLNKEKYARQQRLKLDRAKMLASSHFFNAREAVARADVSQAVTSYFRAVSELQDFIGEDLTHNTVEGSINYATDIMGDLRNLYRSINLTAVNEELFIEFSRQMQEPLVVQAEYFDGDGFVPVSNLPVAFSFSDGEGVLNAQPVTNQQGYAQSVINRLISKRKMQEVSACFDLGALVAGEDMESPLLPYFFPEEELPCTRFTIELNKSTAFCNIDEIVFGEKDARSTFGRLIRSDLNDYFFNFSQDPDSADYKVNLNLQFRKGDERKGTGYSVFLVYADLHVSVISLETQTEIFSDGFLEVRGMRPGSYNHALREARDNVLQRFRNEILPKLEEVDI